MPHPYPLTQTLFYQHAWPFLPDPPNPHTLPNEKKSALKSSTSTITGPLKISPLDQWQHDWIASGVFEEGANSSGHALRYLVPSTLQQL